MSTHIWIGAQSAPAATRSAFHPFNCHSSMFHNPAFHNVSCSLALVTILKSESCHPTVPKPQLQLWGVHSSGLIDCSNTLHLWCVRRPRELLLPSLHNGSHLLHGSPDRKNYSRRILKNPRHVQTLHILLYGHWLVLPLRKRLSWLIQAYIKYM